MPITITITDPTPEQIAALFGVGPHTARIVHETVTETPASKPVSRKKPATPDGGMDQVVTVSEEDAELARELAADVAEAPPEPKGATQVVDGGTGKPIEQVEQVEQVAQPTAMTMDEVRASATRLAQANAPGLKAILNGFGAAKLSEVKPDDLPDFVQQVLDALG